MDDMKKLYKIWIVSVKFYQNTAMLIGLCIVCDRAEQLRDFKA